MSTPTSFQQIKTYAEANEISFDELMETLYDKKPEISKRDQHIHQIYNVTYVYGIYYLLSQDHTILHKTRRLNITYPCSLARPSSDEIKYAYEQLGFDNPNINITSHICVEESISQRTLSKEEITHYDKLCEKANEYHNTQNQKPFHL